MLPETENISTVCVFDYLNLPPCGIPTDYSVINKIIYPVQTNMGLGFGARFTNKVKSIMMSSNFSPSQLAWISLAEFVSKLILI